MLLPAGVSPWNSIFGPGRRSKYNSTLSSTAKRFQLYPSIVLIEMIFLKNGIAFFLRLECNSYSVGKVIISVGVVCLEYQILNLFHMQALNDFFLFMLSVIILHTPKIFERDLTRTH